MNNLEWKKVVKVYLMALGMGLLITAGIAMVSASLVAAEKMPENSTGYGAMISVFCGCVTTSMIAAGSLKTMRFPVSVVAGAVFFLGLILWGLLLFGRLHGGILPTAALCLGAGAIVGMLGQKRSGKPKYKLPKMGI